MPFPISTRFNPLFAKWIIDRKPAEVEQNKKGSRLFLHDLGATNFNAKCPWFFKLAGQQRHACISTILSFHALSSQRIIAPILRSLCTYYLVFRLTNWKILRTIHEEVLSCLNDAQVATFPTFFENFKAYTGGEFDKKARTVKPVYKGLAVHTTSGLVSWQLGE